jgi:hypothetical protein
MTQKRILRANTRKVARERDLVVRDIFRMYAKDPDHADIPNLINELVEDDPNASATVFFAIAARLVDELAEATGSTPEQILRRTPLG